MMFVDENMARTAGVSEPEPPCEELPKVIYVRFPEFTPLVEQVSELRLQQIERALRTVGSGPMTNSVNPHVNKPQVGRNEPCVCGSGKKRKRCCR